MPFKYLRFGVILWKMMQMTANNVVALLVIEAGVKKALAGIITERGGSSIEYLGLRNTKNIEPYLTLLKFKIFV